MLVAPDQREQFITEMLHHFRENCVALMKLSFDEFHRSCEQHLICCLLQMEAKYESFNRNYVNENSKEVDTSGSHGEEGLDESDSSKYRENFSITKPSTRSYKQIAFSMYNRIL